MAPESNEHEIDGEIIARLFELQHRMAQRREEIASSLGLAPAEAQALHHLDVPAPMRAMADTMCCDASYVTVLADRLEERGLVQREADPADRRVKRPVLTNEGRALRSELIDRYHATAPALVGLDPAQRRAFVRLLRRLAPPA